MGGVWGRAHHGPCPGLPLIASHAALSLSLVCPGLCQHTSGRPCALLGAGRACRRTLWPHLLYAPDRGQRVSTWADALGASSSCMTWRGSRIALRRLRLISAAAMVLAATRHAAAAPPSAGWHSARAGSSVLPVLAVPRAMPPVSGGRFCSSWPSPSTGGLRHAPRRDHSRNVTRRSGASMDSSATAAALLGTPRTASLGRRSYPSVGSSSVRRTG